MDRLHRDLRHGNSVFYAPAVGVGGRLEGKKNAASYSFAKDVDVATWSSATAGGP